MPRRTVLVLCTVIGVLASAATPAAATEQQWKTSANFGLSTLGFVDATLSGLGGGGDLTYGVNDAINLRVSVEAARFGVLGPDGNEQDVVLYGATAGAEYVIDILRWVPYVGALIGPHNLRVPGEHARQLLGLEIPLGLGYQITPHVTVGIEGRLEMFLLTDDNGPTNASAAFGRAAYVWGD